MNKTQAFTFFGILLVGLGVSIFTLNKFGKTVEVEEGEDNKPPVVQTPDNPQTEPGSGGGTDKPVGSKPEVPAPKTEGFRSADALVSAMSDSIKNRNPETFFKIVGPEAATPLVQAQVTKLIKDPGFELDSDQPTAQIAKVAGSFSRWAIRLKQTEGASLPEDAPEIAEIYTDVAKAGKDDTWTIEKVALPLEVTGFLGDVPIAKVNMPGIDPANPNAPGNPNAPEGSGPGTAKVPGASGVDAPDALTVAHAFSKAIVDKKFKLARQMTDEDTISDERVAALMIAVEDGKFQLRNQEPLVVTLNRENMVWVLTRIDASGGNSSSEFGLEMGKKGDDWKINGLAFNKLLTELASQAGAGGTAYAPMIENPQGGESLVIYFDFDKDGVTTRANRQLEIVANILSEDPGRKIRINGHADALGTDQYNEGLSNSRAAAIRKALVGAGVAPSQIITESFGESRPLRPNFKNDGTDDPSGRSQNRRAEVYLDF